MSHKSGNIGPWPVISGLVTHRTKPHPTPLYEVSTSRFVAPPIGNNVKIDHTQNGISMGLLGPCITPKSPLLEFLTQTHLGLNGTLLKFPLFGACNDCRLSGHLVVTNIEHSSRTFSIWDFYMLKQFLEEKAFKNK